MGKEGSSGEGGKKAMWLYPKVVGSSPSERWGHSACFSQGLLYVFGGCCGGMHFSDVLVLNLDTMAWTTLVTSGSGPGPRDSHSATLWGNRMIVFGGTNGSKKVNGVHILDLGSREWSQPVCHGTPPSPRESHTATIVGGDKLVVFGGSGEGVGNYLNDLHILDLKTMRWTNLPEVKGDFPPPPPRDSHVSIAVGSKLFVYGGDCGDRYLGDVDVFDINTLMWTRLEVQGSSPGRRAGHAAVRIGTKVCVIGGVGDKKYYNDAWVLDTSTCSWARLETCGQQPQGRFSHTAVVADCDIVIYGGCGEDERPLGELLVLQLGGEHPNGRYNISLCKNFRSYLSQENRRKGIYGAEKGLKKMLIGDCIKDESKELAHELDASNSKKRRTTNANSWERESEQEEHSLSLSQNSSPSQSDQEQTTVPNPTPTIPVSRGLPFPSLNKSRIHSQPNKWIPQQNQPDVYFLGEHRPNPKHGHFSPSWQTPEGRSINQTAIQSLMGAEVQGKVDGAFDSGYLMTANVNGRFFRGVLFAPGPNVMQRGSNLSQNTSGQIPFAQPYNSHRGSTYGRRSIVQPVRNPDLGSEHGLDLEKVDRPSHVFRDVPLKNGEMRERGDLQGLVLTLGGPGSGHGS